MQKKKDNILEKIVKRNYNDDLETILEEKDFAENARSILLSILYKIEASYKDVEIVKQDIESKDEYIKNYIYIIQNKCNNIKIVSMKEQENKIGEGKTFVINKENKEIECYPIERKLLYAISKLAKPDKIVKDKYYIINETLSDLINTGNSINMVEPLRDFNGYSWTTIPREIESVTHNLIYQNLRILLGYIFLNKWINNSEFVLDYFEEYKNLFKETYGNKNEKEFTEKMLSLSILLDAKYDEEKMKELLKEKEKIQKESSVIKNREKFIEEKTKEKMKITEKIREYDTILNNKKMLEEEYVKRNEKLPLEKKIFSIKVLAEIMSKEREELFEKIEKINSELQPKNFIKYEKELNQKHKYLDLVTEDKEEMDDKINELLIKLQKKFLECFKMKVQNAKTKQEIIKLIYEYRYYLLIPYNYEKSIYEVGRLKEKIQNTSKELIKKAHEMKVIKIVSRNEDLNYEILKNIFNSRIIKLEDVYLKITNEKEKFYLQLFDEQLFEEKIEISTKQGINVKELEYRLNKKIELFD